MHLLISSQNSKYLRAALLDTHGRCLRFFLWEREHSQKYRLGDIYLARLVERDQAFGWIDIGEEENYPISIDKIKNTPIGALLTCKIVRLFMPDAAHIWAQKGLKFKPTATKNIVLPKQVGLIKRVPHELTFLIDQVRHVTVETPEIATWFRELTGQTAQYARTNEQPLFAHFDVEESWQELLETSVHVENGNLYLDETPLGVIMDINTRGGRKDQINQSACDVIARVIAQRHLTGPIIIDFAAIQNNIEQQNVKKPLQDALRTYQLHDVRIAGWSPLKHLELFRPRDRMSLTAQLKAL